MTHEQTLARMAWDVIAHLAGDERRHVLAQADLPQQPIYHALADLPERRFDVG
jgi:hypothetical protein